MDCESEATRMPLEKQFDVNEALGSAMEAFWARGFEATSIQDLVAAMGVNRGSLYSTYGDKRDIFIAALRAYDQRHRAAPLALLEARFSPGQAIAKLFESFADNPDDGARRRGCFMNNTALELAAHDREIAAIVGHAQQGLQDFFVRMIRKGQAAGEIRSNIDAEEKAAGLLAALLGLNVLCRSQPDRKFLRAVAKSVLQSLE